VDDRLCRCDRGAAWATENGQPGLLGYGLSMLAPIEAARVSANHAKLAPTRCDEKSRLEGVGCMRVYNYAALGAANKC
jgi:hypothetical protein